MVGIRFGKHLFFFAQVGLPSNFKFFPNAGGAAGTSVAGYLAHLLEEEGEIFRDFC